MKLLLVPFDGLQDYLPVWRAMQQFTQRRLATTADQIWLLQHAPVYTLGQTAKAEHVLDTGATPLVQTDRGGQVTWHGPGQQMIYLLLDVKRLGLGARALVTAVEQATIAALAAFGIAAYARADRPGVYIANAQGEAKIAALGLRIKAQGCYHGLCVNIDCALDAYRGINPCGYAGVPAARLSDLAPPVSGAQYIEAWLAAFNQQLGQVYQPQWASAQRQVVDWLSHEESL